MRFAKPLIQPESEDDEQQTLFNLLERLTPRIPELACAFSIPNGGKRHITTARRMRATGQKSGIPDLMMAVARGGFYGLFIEMKSKKGTVAATQKIWIERLRAQGYRVEVCYSAAEAVATIEDYLGVRLIKWNT